MEDAANENKLSEYCVCLVRVRKELDTQRDGDLHARRRCVPASSGNSRCSVVDGVEDARRDQLHPPRARPWREAGLRVAHHLAVSPKSTRRSLVLEQMATALAQRRSLVPVCRSRWRWRSPSSMRPSRCAASDSVSSTSSMDVWNFWAAEWITAQTASTR